MLPLILHEIRLYLHGNTYSYSCLGFQQIIAVLTLQFIILSTVYRRTYMNIYLCCMCERALHADVHSSVRMLVLSCHVRLDRRSFSFKFLVLLFFYPVVLIFFLVLFVLNVYIYIIEVFVITIYFPVFSLFLL